MSSPTALISFPYRVLRSFTESVRRPAPGQWDLSGLTTGSDKALPGRPHRKSGPI